MKEKKNQKTKKEKKKKKVPNKWCGFFAGLGRRPWRFLSGDAGARRFAEAFCAVFSFFFFLSLFFFSPFCSLFLDRLVCCWTCQQSYQAFAVEIGAKKKRREKKAPNFCRPRFAFETLS